MQVINLILFMEKSQNGYVFTYGGTAISWRSQKQTRVSTSTNHAEVIALHETSRECVWLRSMIKHIKASCGFQGKENPTILYEYNAACFKQLQDEYIKKDRTKHIPPMLFAYTRELIKDGDVNVQKIESKDNVADLFTKSLPPNVFLKHVHNIGMRHLHKT